MLSIQKYLLNEDKVNNKKTPLLHRFAGGAYYIHGLSPFLRSPSKRLNVTEIEVKNYYHRHKR